MHIIPFSGNNCRGIGLLGCGRAKRNRELDQDFREFDVYIQSTVHRVLGTVVRELRESKPRGTQRDH